MDAVKVHFLGASQTVTGSKYLLETPELNILIDCGMFQGLKELRLLIWEKFPFPPENIDLILLTHGHLDHCGYLPKLWQQGFTGAIIGSAPTLEIASIILRDSAKIQEEDAARANENGTSIHDPAKPFYTIKDAEATIKLFQQADMETWMVLNSQIKVRFKKNGHILGATFIELKNCDKVFLFSGDIGRVKDRLLEAPEKPDWADFLFLESTYGNRLHAEEDVEAKLIQCIKEVLANKGNLIIPSFAVERLQTLMYILWKLFEQNKIPNIPIFIDSPMANKVFSVFEQYTSWHKISLEELEHMKQHFNIITSYKDTWKTVDDTRSKIIIAGSGMVSGGRVLTYLKYLISKPETIVLLVGYQAEGTRGRTLKEGGKELKIYGKYYEVNAKIENIDSLSAHADQAEILDWVSKIRNIPETTFLIHGERIALDALRLKIKDTLQWKVYIPHLYEVVELSV